MSCDNARMFYKYHSRNVEGHHKVNMLNKHFVGGSVCRGPKPDLYILVSSKNCDLWLDSISEYVQQHRKSAIHGLLIKSDRSDWWRT